MSKRLQVSLTDREMADIRTLAAHERLTVGDWVRRALRDARTRQSVNDPEAKLKAIRRGAQYSFPTSDIDQMLSEIDAGRWTGLDRIYRI
jgi:hypothetical protein